jgi:hypothetical protein
MQPVMPPEPPPTKTAPEAGRLPGLLADGTLDPVFRSGSLTAISVVVGFSLSFLNRWASSPGEWHIGDLVTIVLIVAGTAAQLLALVEMLRVQSLLPKSYNRTMQIFLAGLGLVAVGILASLIEDVVGLSQHILGAE